MLATLIRKTASPALSVVVLFGALGLIVWSYLLPSPVEQYPLRATLAAPAERELILYDATGERFARRGGCYGAPVTQAELPDHFVDALLAMEDRRFYSHFGIDVVGVVRAALANYNAGRVVQGGSTITQQLAKISYLTSARTVSRKLEEAVAVLRLEAALSKDEILERYLSRAYFGEGCYGLRAAARHYFGEQVNSLTIPQSAFLVALLKSPTILASNPEMLRERTELVLKSMVDDERLDQARLAELVPAERISRERDRAASYYADWIAETVELPKSGDMTPLPVRTALVPSLQKAAEEAVDTILKRSGKSRKASQAALVAMRPDGRVVAMVGGVNYEQSQFNRATQAMRQPGSSFKSFVYLAALRAGGNPDMMVVDEPLKIGDWEPENYGESYRGVVSLRRAFASSINTVAVRLSEAVGRRQVIKAAQDLGITSPLHNDPSIALGTSEVTLLELTSAYAAFAANAYPVKPWGIVGTSMETPENPTPPEGAGLWRLDNRSAMREFLSATVQSGTGRGARLWYSSFGKTGTSQNYRDAWFIGFGGNLVVGVWVGNDDNSPMARVTGGNLPTMIWAKFMSRAGKQDPEFSPKLPKQVAGFPAKPDSTVTKVAHSGGLEALLVQATHYAAPSQSGAYFGNRTRPMAFGYTRSAGEQQSRPAPRSRQRQMNSRELYNRVFGGDW